MSTVIHAAGRALVPAADFLSPYDFFRDLTNPALAFLPRALLIAVVAALVCGSVGVHVVLRGMAFIGDAVAHSVFPRPGDRLRVRRVPGVRRRARGRRDRRARGAVGAEPQA